MPYAGPVSCTVVKVLLDECVDSRRANYLRGFEATTVAAHGWSGITNGKLLALAYVEFDVFVTVDRNLSFQKNIGERCRRGLFFATSTGWSPVRRKADSAS